MFEHLRENSVNQNYATTGVKHVIAMLLMMALEDENHERLNIDYVSSQATPPSISVGSEAKWLRDLFPVVDPKIYEQVRNLLNVSIAVPGGTVDRQLFEDTAKNITVILRGLSESYRAQYASTASVAIALWEPGCWPHPSLWVMREAVGALLA
jgi:hypothetical protein